MDRIKNKKIIFIHRLDKWQKYIEKIVIALIILIPLININEIKMHFGIIERGGSAFLIKLIKDLGFILLFILCILRMIYQSIPKYILLPIIAIIFLICISVFLSMDEDPIVLIAGIRWILPLILLILLKDCITLSMMKKFALFLYIMLYVNLAAQIYETFNMPLYHGVSYLGLAARVPGLFSHAHSCGCFICLCYYMNTVFFPNRPYKNLWDFCVFTSILLAMSSTGIIVWTILFFLFQIKKNSNFKIYMLIIPLIGLLTYKYADIIIGRGIGASESSVGTRTGFLTKLFFNADYFSSTFGWSTHAIMQLKGKGIASDAFYGSFIANLGLIPFFILCITIIILAIKGYRTENTTLLGYILLFGLCGVSSIIWEVYPCNLFFSIIGAFLLSTTKVYEKYHKIDNQNN